ncbi:MAG TPA: hypothetical protein VLL28_00945, partial [Hyphomicrobiaceae bacterium]|nr:hypothetical protein [Hyphomicrobiaceae bacterium]
AHNGRLCVNGATGISHRTRACKARLRGLAALGTRPPRAAAEVQEKEVQGKNGSKNKDDASGAEMA